jgi:hypothetical protein
MCQNVPGNYRMILLGDGHGECPKNPVSSFIYFLINLTLHFFFWLVKHTTILSIYNHHSLEILRRVEKNVPLLLMSSQSNEKQVVKFKSTEKKKPYQWRQLPGYPQCLHGRLKSCGPLSLSSSLTPGQ